MTMGAGINGLGRIGRLLIRRAIDEGNLDIRVVNASHPVESIAHLLKYDTVHGRWNADIATDNGNLIINGKTIKVIAERDPGSIPWKELGVDLVMDATGKFTDREGAAKHLKGGAERVVITAPGKNMDLTVVMGANDHLYDPDHHRIISAASCTTNCVAPVLRMLDEQFGVIRAWVTTVHAYTNDQNHLDNPHKDLRRARACGQSIVPTTTGIGKALSGVLPHLAPVVEGVSLRVPVPNVSLADITVELGDSVSREAAAAALKAAAASRPFAPYVDWSEEPLVSADYIGCDKSATIDGLSLAAAGNQMKLLAWYDNEWGYACRVIDAALMTERCSRSHPVVQAAI
ncbi:type I glyceraldehyde-3-phosphate dehydrogenase [Paenibacillus mesophilus]|uniref:type I glyceraldehyde-3-phosphate dehydrogenase n=1 Tax=Paenibacillus mesophilus TaxID=2582849 RepID=UPI00110DBD2B|nr:type I glyceraldehyde-3-phosphate dehydrogenase [Paenibacillus mesophilus]TMV51450.1 type I glyceraldehyde-3-phosphate dehydrogenase [Paenibacillus mesophilus]